ncbi:glycosyl transferase [Pontibacter vulgaris]|uniref:glycosyl transferase n=1 Tax=Pontibacter vulgaris TaxID=2905679 RepID=UPI001FA7C0DB|nr:glycosyl transferase [Pontibacter vulgaris]
MTIAFTLCSNNYLGAAKVLIDSLKIYHPEFHIYIGLVDKIDKQIDYQSLECNIILAEDIYLPENIESLCQKFNIVELNTTVKPFFFSHFFNILNADKVVYLDPDIQLFSPMEEVLLGLEKAMITLTPHMLTPVDDNFGPNDYHILRTGIFNLGFVALSEHKELNCFLNWWGDRCLKYGYRRDDQGMFYDQIWINYIPAFYESYYIIRHPGYNAANWNLHERHFKMDNNSEWEINSLFKLIFFHFSHFDVNKPERISIYNNRFNFNNRPDIAPLFENYQQALLKNGSIFFKSLVPYYKTKHEEAIAKRNSNNVQLSFKQKLKRKVITIFNKHLLLNCL